MLEEGERERDRESYHTNVRSIVISAVSILFGLITEEASVVAMMMMPCCCRGLRWHNTTTKTASPSIGSQPASRLSVLLAASVQDRETSRNDTHAESHTQGETEGDIYIYIYNRERERDGGIGTKIAKWQKCEHSYFSQTSKILQILWLSIGSRVDGNLVPC